MSFEEMQFLWTSFCQKFTSLLLTDGQKVLMQILAQTSILRECSAKVLPELAPFAPSRANTSRTTVLP